MDILDRILDLLISFATTTGIRLVISIIILLVGLKLIRVLVKVISRSVGYNRIEPSVQGFIRSFISIGLKIMLGISIASYLGLEMTSVLAVLASAGLAIGLALQGALSNLAGGLMILIFKPFRVGDYINNHTDAGTVSEINIFYTVLKTIDNCSIMLPNGELTNTSIINYSMEERRRVDLVFTTDYDADIEKVKAILLDVANAHKFTIIEPDEPFCRMTEHGDSALSFALRVWTMAENYWPMRFDLIEQVKIAFDINEIEIPFPQMDVHLDQKIKQSEKISNR